MFCRFKARLVALGNHQKKDIDYHDTYAPVFRLDLLRLCLAFSTTSNQIEVDQMDVVTAFLNGDLNEEIYLKTPQGYQSRARFVRLLKSLYGLKQAPNEWHKVINKLVDSLGFKPVEVTPCVYVKWLSPQQFVIVIVYVDDIGFIGSRDLIDSTKSALAVRLKMKDLGSMSK